MEERLYDPPCAGAHEPCSLYFLPKKDYRRLARDYTSGVSPNSQMVEDMTSLHDRVMHLYKELLEFVSKHDVIDALEQWQVLSESHRETLLEEFYKFWPQENFLLNIGLGAYNHQDACDIKHAFLLPRFDKVAMSCEPRLLFVLLDQYTGFKPWERARFDAEDLRFGLSLQAFGPYFARGCVFVNDQNASTYGTISPYDNEAVHRGDAFPTHVASLFFEGQARAMHMLSEILRPLLRNSVHTTLGRPGNDWPKLISKIEALKAP
jgi:hypothetical protein